MSTKQSIKFREFNGERPGYHLYHDVLDDGERPVYLELHGVQAEMGTIGHGAIVTVTIPDEMARALGLLPHNAMLSGTDRAGELEKNKQEALALISEYGGIDGEHHKQWVLDQVVRILTGDGYAAWVVEQKDGEDGPETYAWEEGIAP